MIATVPRRFSGASLRMPGDGRRESPSGLELAGLGLYLAAAFVVPLLAGLGVDAVARTAPLGLLAGLLAGLVAVVAGLWVSFRRYL